MLDLGEESHFELACCLVDLEELFEALFEDGVAEGVSHDVVAASRVKAGLHLEHTDLIKGCHEQIYHDSCLLRACCQILVVFDCLLEMLSVILLLLNVEVRADLLLERLRDYHTWPVSDRAAN